jgi:flagellar M-ring protein FliF
LDPKSPKSKPNVNPEYPLRHPGISSPPLNANSSDRQNEIRNYEISRINKRIKNPVGNIKKISSAVIVDGGYKEVTDEKGKKGRQYISRSPEEMKSLENMVKKAIGYDEQRGDQVEVINMPFYGSAVEEDIKPEKGNSWQEDLMMAYKPVVSLILAFLCIFFVVRPLLKKKISVQGREMAIPEPAPVSMIPSETPQGAKLTPELDLRDQTLQLVKGDPSKAVGIVKTWLHEKE